MHKQIVLLRAAESARQIRTGQMTPLEALGGSFWTDRKGDLKFSSVSRGLPGSGGRSS
jgi:hypothetical protein